MSKDEEIKALKELFENVWIRFYEAMDYMGNIQINYDDYKQIMSGLTKKIKDLDQNLLDLTSFSPSPIEDKGEEPGQELVGVLDALDAMILEKPEKKKILSALPSDQKKISNEGREREKIKQESSSSPKLPPTTQSDFGFTPIPKLKKSAEASTSITPVPKFNDKLKTSSKSQQKVSPQEVPLEETTLISKIPAKTKIEPLEKIPEKKMNLQNTDDVFYNLMIDIDLSENYKQLGSNIRLAADFLKQFVKFHKVLFDMLKVASDTNKEKGRLSKEYKNEIKQKIEEWKKEVYII